MAVAQEVRPRVPDGAVFGGVALVAWGLAVVAAVTGWDVLLHHDAVGRHGGWPGLWALVLFLVAWQVMTAAMMLPSSLPLLHLFTRTSQGQEHPRLAGLAFVAAYFTVWTGFAVGALITDAGVHQLVHRWSWLHERPWVVGGSVLLLAGGFQFSPLKERCLRQCRNPFTFLRRHYQRGVISAWALGLRHGLFCLGCCWALMLVMVAVGVGHLAWMAALTGVMVLEKTSRQGPRLAPLVGVVVLVWGGLVLLHPEWLPSPLSFSGGTD